MENLIHGLLQKIEQTINDLMNYSKLKENLIKTLVNVRSLMWKKVKKGKNRQDLYSNRKLSSRYPDLEHLGSLYKKEHNAKSRNQIENDIDETRNILIDCFFNLVDLNSLSKRALDIGCGPTPKLMKQLIDNGLDAKGVEPVEEMCQSARKFLSDESKIIKGIAEEIPVPDSSQSFVILNSVLEHVQSPPLTLNEIYRVLEPGGVAYIQTTNRHMFSNNEYIKRFYQWYPEVLKESYVYMHLHYRPELARYSSRPAVHWFSYSDLCKLGRNAGFFSFYSLIDLISEDDINKRQDSTIIKKLLIKSKFNPLLRSFLLKFTGIGQSIFMFKSKPL